MGTIDDGLYLYSYYDDDDDDDVLWMVDEDVIDLRSSLSLEMLAV